MSSLALDELIGNLKVHEVVMEKDSEFYKGKKERIKSIALKAKKESSDDETLTSESDDEEYAMALRNFKKCGDPNHLIGDCPKPSRNKDQKDFIGGSWSNSENDAMAIRNFKKFFRRKGKFVRNQEKKRSHSDKEIRRKERVTENVLDAVIQIISLAIVQNHLATKIKRLSLEVLGAIARMTLKTKPTTKLVSWLNHQISANSLKETLNNQKSPSCKIGLGFDSEKASTSGTKTMSFVRSSAEKATDGSTIKGHVSTLPGSVSRKDDQKGTEHVFSPPLSSRSDTQKRYRLCQNRV
ncbi:hypothetical protein Tco_1322680 [Tanacetum coccineum]